MRSGSVFLMELTDVGGRPYLSRRVVDHRPVPSRVPLFEVFFLRDYSIRTFIGTLSEVPKYDPEFLTDSSDGILLKELKSMIQEHSTNRSFFIPPATCRAE